MSSQNAILSVSLFNPLATHPPTHLDSFKDTCSSFLACTTRSV